VSPYIPTRTGLSRYCDVYGRLLASAGHRVRVLADCRGVPSEHPAPGMRVDHVWRPGSLALWGLFDALRTDPGDVIHLHHSFTAYGGAPSVAIAPLALHRLRRIRPLVITMFDLFPRSEVTTELLQMYDIRWPPPLVWEGMRLEVRAMSAYADKIVVHNEAAMEILEWDYRVPRSKLALFPHLMYRRQGATQCLAPRRDPGSRPQVVLFYGFLAPYKGLEVLLQAFSRACSRVPADSLVLRIAGENHPRLTYDYAAELGRKVARLGLTSRQVEFLGYLPEDQIETVVASCDLFVAPYLRTTGSSGALSTAMGLERPIAASALPALAQQLAGYPHTCLVSPGHVEGITKALVELARGQGPTSERGSMESAPAPTSGELIAQTIAIYERVLERSGLRSSAVPPTPAA